MLGLLLSKSSLENKAKLDVYKCLYRIDKKLGTKPEIQLYWCCRYAVNINIIEVIDINKLYFIILFLSFSKILKLISNFKERKMVARYSEFYFNNVLNTSKQMISQKHHWKAKNSNSWSITLKIYFSNYQWWDTCNNGLSQPSYIARGICLSLLVEDLLSETTHSLLYFNTTHIFPFICSIIKRLYIPPSFRLLLLATILHRVKLQVVQWEYWTIYWRMRSN